MLIMGAHKMLTLGAAVTGTVDGPPYTAAALCDGDPHEPIRVADGVVDFDLVPVVSVDGVNGIVIANANLDEDAVVSFSDLGDVVGLPVPENGVRLNPYTLITPAVDGLVAITVSGPLTAPAVIGEAIAGVFEEIFPVAGGPSSPFEGFGIDHPGEFRGLAYERGAEARGFGGTGLVTAAEKAILDSCWRASRENSRPTVIVPFAWSDDAWLVLWEQYEARPFDDDRWEVSVSWRELPRYRWPA